LPQVQCATCLAMTSLPPGTDPHAVTWCGCCTIEHHHAEGNDECAADDSHECYRGVTSGPRPDGCKVCRPVIHFANADALAITPEA
jgi:hypothetical protein